MVTYKLQISQFSRSELRSQWRPDQQSNYASCAVWKIRYAHIRIISDDCLLRSMDSDFGGHVTSLREIKSLELFVQMLNKATGDFTTSFLHFPCSPLPSGTWRTRCRPVHSLMLSSHLVLCLPCLLHSFTVPYKVVLARPDERETCPCHCSLRLFTMVRRSHLGPVASKIEWKFTLKTENIFRHTLFCYY